MQAIANTTLADQAELAKITPEIVSTEDLSKLWTAFQANYYRTTAAYQASVVLIRATPAGAQQSAGASRNIAVQPLERAADRRHSMPSHVGAGETLTIQGRNFIGDAIGRHQDQLRRRRAGRARSGAGQGAQGEGAGHLPAGIRTVQVARNVRFGAPTDPHPRLRLQPGDLHTGADVAGADPRPP